LYEKYDTLKRSYYRVIEPNHDRNSCIWDGNSNNTAPSIGTIAG